MKKLKHSPMKKKTGTLTIVLVMGLSMSMMVLSGCSGGSQQQAAPQVAFEDDEEFDCTLNPSLCEDNNNNNNNNNNNAPSCTPTKQSSNNTVKGGLYPTVNSLSADDGLSGWACDQDVAGANIIVNLYYRSAGSTGSFVFLAETVANIPEPGLSPDSLQNVFKHDRDLCGGTIDHKFVVPMSEISKKLTSGMQYEVMAVGIDPETCNDDTELGHTPSAIIRTLDMP